MFELERMVEEAVTMDSESTEYLKLKQEVEAFIHFRPDAKVDDFMMRYMELHEDANPLLPIMVAGKVNTERNAREAMQEHIGNLEEALKAFLKIRKNASPKSFFEEYRAFGPTVTKEAVVTAYEKFDGEGFITELWVDKPLSREEAEEAGKEAIAEFGRMHPEAAEFLKGFHWKISDLTVEETFDLMAGEILAFDKDAVEDVLHRKFYEDKEDLIKSEIVNLETRFEEWAEEYA